MKNSKGEKRNGWLSLIYAKGVNTLNLISKRVSDKFNMKVNWVRNAILASLVMLFLCALTGSIFFMALAVLIGAAVSGVSLSPSHSNDTEEQSGDNENYGSNGSNGSDGSTGS
ncbi:TPA: hypothetical protein QIT95_005613 [Klebsiella michiganensis]|nr:hypothetical protein [Klebsiella michiganensis]ELS4625814.1 hypothetical protein [Klebsiella michiganensis]HCU0766828.1 hypothetical protein [Klebsiella michiganensis]HEP0440740.1 hypothetical protein [Klebsiella michiganensis]HEP0466819.1 hypothetical protein [Klebsiella michiganensis]